MVSQLVNKVVAIVLFVCAYASLGMASEPLYCARDLARLSTHDLECVYRQAEAGNFPNGFARGHAVYKPDAFLGKAKSTVAQLIWKGKHFCAEDANLVNQWFGVKAIRATMSYGPSWLDGKPAIILDYGGTSKLWADVRDEMREVSPGVYIGMMYLRRCPEPRLKLFFVLGTQGARETITWHAR